MGRVIGIDLGTTNSVVAVMEGNKPIVIANSEGTRTTPSVVGFNKDGELLVGQMARRQSVLNPQNTYYGVKRFMGRKYTELNPESKQVPYTIRRTEEDNIKIRCPRLRQEFSPEEISAKIIRRLADEAERYLGEPVTGAVITVPAYFNDSQRQATRDAGRIAGLEVLRIINEPTAAALAYGLEQKQSTSILVFDLGGGTFDVSVLEVGDGVFEVKSTSGDTQLGGNDFDRKIVDWLAEKFLEDEKIDLRKDRQSLQRLTEAAEKAKIELSGVTVTEINLPFITATEDGPKHLETQLDRATFESICGELVSRLRRPIKRALQDAGISPVQIREVVLVGGSTRIPIVQGLVRSFIDREPNQNVNPDEVVAVGAAIQAGILTQEVKALHDSYLVINEGVPPRQAKGRIFISKAVILLCLSKKSRDPDHLQNMVYDQLAGLEAETLAQELRESGEYVAIPEYAYDCHTREGKKRGKTKSDFFKAEQAALKPFQPGLFDHLIET